MSKIKSKIAAPHNTHAAPLAKEAQLLLVRNDGTRPDSEVFQDAANLALVSIAHSLCIVTDLLEQDTQP